MWRLIRSSGVFIPMRQLSILLLTLTLYFLPQHANAFLQKAVDKLFETGKCIRCDLKGVDFSGKDLRSFELMGSNLDSANLSGANLSGADLRGTWLMRVKLREANLENANLTGAHLLDADLTNANLREAIFQRSQLGRAVLSGANVNSAQFLWASMQATNLVGVVGLKQVQIGGACGDPNTVLPIGVTIPFCQDIQR